MRGLVKALAAMILLAASPGSIAAWGWNPWPVWTPMFWAEVFFGTDWDYGPYGHYPWSRSGYLGPYYGSPYAGAWGAPSRWGPRYPYSGGRVWSAAPYYGAWGPYHRGW